jgi:hypothetical protein
MGEAIIEACEENRLAFSASSAAVLSVLCVLRLRWDSAEGLKSRSTLRAAAEYAENAQSE